MLSLIHLSNQKDDYIYRQIYKQIKIEILLNHFLPNEKLPSKRELAESLHVSINSVNGAYQQLLAEGYIYSVERSGFFVEKLEKVPTSFSTLKPLNPNLAERSETKKDWISFSHMSADRSVFPFDGWLNCEHKALKSKRTELNDDSSRYPQGIYSVRCTISRLLSITRGVKCYPEQIVIGAGTQILIQILCHLFPEGSKYAMEEPGYSRIYQLLKLQHADITSIELDRKGIAMSEIIKQDPNILYITPSHQFPTGIVMPISRRIQLLNWSSQAKNRYIIEDDYDSEFKYQSDAIPSIQGMDTFDKVIYMGTFSKSLLPGLRISYMVLPQHLLQSFRESEGFLMQTCNVLAQLALQEFIDSGEYQKHIKRMKQIYSERQTRLIKELDRRFGKNIAIHGANAGLHFMCTFKTERSIEDILNQAEQEKLELYSIKRCYLTHDRPPKKPVFILGFANLPLEKIEDGVDRLYRSVFGS